MVTDNFFVHRVSRLGHHADDDRIGNKSLHKGIPVVREVRSCLRVGSRCCGPQSHHLSKGLLQRVSSFRIHRISIYKKVDIKNFYSIRVLIPFFIFLLLDPFFCLCPIFRIILKNCLFILILIFGKCIRQDIFMSNEII